MVKFCTTCVAYWLVPSAPSVRPTGGTTTGRNGVLIVFTGCAPSIVPVYEVVASFTKSLFGFKPNETKLGIQKIPYPPRMTGLGSQLEAQTQHGSTLSLGRGVM